MSTYPLPATYFLSSDSGFLRGSEAPLGLLEGHTDPRPQLFVIGEYKLVRKFRAKNELVEVSDIVD